MHLVGFLLHMAEVVSLAFLILQTLLVRIQHDVLVGDASWDVLLFTDEHRLRYVLDVLNGTAVGYGISHIQDDLLSHAIGDHVSP